MYFRYFLSPTTCNNGDLIVTDLSTDHIGLMVYYIHHRVRVGDPKHCLPGSTYYMIGNHLKQFMSISTWVSGCCSNHFSRVTTYMHVISLQPLSIFLLAILREFSECLLEVQYLHPVIMGLMINKNPSELVLLPVL